MTTNNNIRFLIVSGFSIDWRVLIQQAIFLKIFLTSPWKVGNWSRITPNNLTSGLSSILLSSNIMLNFELWLLLWCFLLNIENSVFFLLSFKECFVKNRDKFWQDFSSNSRAFWCHYHHILEVYPLHIVPFCKFQLNFCSSHLCIGWKLGVPKMYLEVGLGEVRSNSFQYFLLQFSVVYCL